MLFLCVLSWSIVLFKFSVSLFDLLFCCPTCSWKLGIKVSYYYTAVYFSLQFCQCLLHIFRHSMFSSVAQSCPTLWDPMNRSMPGLPVHHQLPEFTQTYVHQVSDAIQPSHPLLSPSLPAPNPSQHHQGLFQWVNSSNQVAKVLEFQLQHQSFQWTSRTDLL